MLPVAVYSSEGRDGLGAGQGGVGFCFYRTGRGPRSRLHVTHTEPGSPSGSTLCGSVVRGQRLRTGVENRSGW